MKILAVAVTSLLSSRCSAFGVRPASFARRGVKARHESASTKMNGNGMKAQMPDNYRDGIDPFGRNPTQFTQRNLNQVPESSDNTAATTAAGTAATNSPQAVMPDEFRDGIDAFGSEPTVYAMRDLNLSPESAPVPGAVTNALNGFDNFGEIDAFGVQPTEFVRRDLNLVPRSSAATDMSPLAVTAAPTKGAVLKLSEPDKFLQGVDVFIFDCDGVIWRGDSLIDGIPETLAKLRAAGKKMFFVTNNSTKSRAGYKKKFDSLGLDIPAEEIFSSSFAAAAYLEQTKFKDTGKKVYIIGEVGICDELDLIGVPYIGGPADSGKQPDMSSGGFVEHDSEVGAVIVGFDRYVNYYKIQYAQLCINENPGCEFIATNLDAVTHLTDAQEWAGNGSMVGAIKGCTGRDPTVVGKPSPLMIDYLCDKLGLERSRICMVGDRLDTDIVFGADNGLQSLLVLSGVTSEMKLLSLENRIKPDFYANTINDFFVQS